MDGAMDAGTQGAYQALAAALSDVEAAARALAEPHAQLLQRNARVTAVLDSLPQVVLVKKTAANEKEEGSFGLHALCPFYTVNWT